MDKIKPERVAVIQGQDGGLDQASSSGDSRKQSDRLTMQINF